jgi:hypothetical protein
MTERTEYLAKRLAQQRDQSIELFRSLTPAQWKTNVHGDESTWDVRTLLSHFISSEVSMSKLIQGIIDTGKGSPDDFDLDRFNSGRATKMAEMTPETLVPQFIETRAATITYVRGLTDAQLDMLGRHASQGMQTIEGIIKIIYKHNQLHEREIRHALGFPQPQRSDG